MWKAIVIIIVLLIVVFTASKFFVERGILGKHKKDKDE